jgi:hypothetical protein
VHGSNDTSASVHGGDDTLASAPGPPPLWASAPSCHKRRWRCRANCHLLARAQRMAVMMRRPQRTVVTTHWPLSLDPLHSGHSPPQMLHPLHRKCRRHCHAHRHLLARAQCTAATTRQPLSLDPLHSRQTLPGQTSHVLRHRHRRHCCTHHHLVPATTPIAIGSTAATTTRLVTLTTKAVALSPWL